MLVLDRPQARLTLAPATCWEMYERQRATQRLFEKVAARARAQKHADAARFYEEEAASYGRAAQRWKTRAEEGQA